MSEPGSSTPRHFAAARPQKMAELVAAEIRTQIIKGELRQDDTLPIESELCDMFAISRPTLREAFRILESEGMITIRQGQRGGPMVNEPTVQTASRYVGLVLQHRKVSIRDVDIAFEMIIPVAARRLAGRHTKRDLAALRSHISDLTSARDDFPRFLELLAAFNYLLLDLTGNQTIAVLGRLLADIVTVHITTMAEDWQGRPPARRSYADAGVKGCERLLELIEAGDAEGAQTFWAAQMEKGDRRATQIDAADRILDLLR
jgi:GntR family transcriptional regulator, transcriptional repressor for pyruvate dehydrogenase complex